MGIFTQSVHKANADLAASLADSASGSVVSRVVGGMVAPAVIGFMGLRACVLGQAVLPGSRGEQLALAGPAAAAFGIALLGVGLFLHVHFVWTVSERRSGWADPCKGFALIVILCALGYMGWRVLAG